MALDDLYKRVLEVSPQAILIASHQTVPETGQSDFLIEYANPGWERLSGSRVDTIEGRAFSTTIYLESTIPWLDFALTVFTDGRTRQQICYSEILEKWLDISISKLDDRYVSVTIIDVTEQKQGELRLKEQNMRLSALSAELSASRNNLKTKLEKIEILNNDLEQLAYYDRLTGLPNRTRFQSLLSEDIGKAGRSGEKLAIAVIDIDNMKSLNDSQGHGAGDELLKQIAQRLSHFGESGIQAGRFGGDEFLLSIHNYEHDAALVHLSNSIQEILGEPYMIFNAEIRASVSIGITTFPEDADNLADLLKYADIAVDDAKKRGKNTISLFHSVMQEKLLARLNMEKRMFLALEQSQFQVFYQPQYDVSTKKLRGFEALVRWFDPELGYVSPEKFIPLAEENRVIVALGDWILRTACETLRDWHLKLGFEGIISVNVSPVQLKSSSFLDDLQGILEACGIRPQMLEIEITEGVLIDDFESSVALLRKIKELGVGISLDDFGTGYSSLSYLQFLPLTTLKIDKSFIANITKDKSVEYDITDAIVHLVNKLGVDTIAEGVETDEQLEIIKRIQCKTIQGFLTGRPMPGKDCEGMIESGRYST
jgi:diguanylate cyclase (GGDEF)-like protein